MSNPRAKPASSRPSSNTRPGAQKLPARSMPARNVPTKRSTVAPSAPAKATRSMNKSPYPKNPPLGSISNKARPKPAASKAPVRSVAPQQAQREGNWLNRTVQNSIAGVGNYAGGFINSIGASVNGIGEGVGQQISNTTRYWGQGVAGYGNNIKDSVGVGGPRIPTGGNPLGLAGQGSSQTAQTKAKTALPIGKSTGSRGRQGGGGANPLGLSDT